MKITISSTEPLTIYTDNQVGKILRRYEKLLQLEATLTQPSTSQVSLDYLLDQAGVELEAARDEKLDRIYTGRQLMERIEQLVTRYAGQKST